MNAYLLQSTRLRTGAAGTLIVLMAAGAGSTMAETDRWGDSVSSVEQSGGGHSQTRVYRSRDGQTVITRDRHSADVVIQRNEAIPPGRNHPGPGKTGSERFGWPRTEDRGRGFYEHRFERPYCSRWGMTCLQQAFRKRILDRLGP